MKAQIDVILEKRLEDLSTNEIEILAEYLANL